jgi:hypothetical protein
MAYIQCTKCGALSASVYKKGDLGKAFAGPVGAMAIPPQLLLAIPKMVSEVTALLRDGLGWWRDRKQLYGVCSACGHVWKID